MNLMRHIITFMMVVLAFAQADAKIPTWTITPKYEQLSRYSGDIYAFQSGGKWGLVRAGNSEISPAKFDFITPFTNGFALAGVKSGNRYVLSSIIGEDGDISELSETYYLPQNGQYISEGKLAIVNKGGKYGFINTSGAVIIKCQFDNALPFKEGWAPVKQGNYTKYITENYDKNPSKSILVVDFHYGEMTLSSCFSNGRAAIAYNKDFALIGTNGQKIKKLNENDFKRIYKNNNAVPKVADNGFSEASTLVSYSENGKFGLKINDNIVITPQLDSFGSQFNDGQIVASINGLFGVISLSEGDFSVEITSNNSDADLDVDRKGNITPVNIAVAYPSTSNISRLKFYIDKGDGNFIDSSSQLSGNNNAAAIVVNPQIAQNSEVCVIKGKLIYDGFLIGEYEKSFTVNYPIRLRITKPGPSVVRANENDIAQFSSTIYNDSNKPITVNAVWSTGKTISVTIPAHGSRTVSDSISVKSNCAKDISISLSTGERAHSTISFQTFF